jgi:hypothetical protein
MLLNKIVQVNNIKVATTRKKRKTREVYIVEYFDEVLNEPVMFRYVISRQQTIRQRAQVTGDFSRTRTVGETLTAAAVLHRGDSNDK